MEHLIFLMSTNLQGVSNQFPGIAHIQQQVKGVLGRLVTGFN